MTTRKCPPESAAELRQRAEARWCNKTGKSAYIFGDLTLRDTNLLLHELQVHQIELEMQNEELFRAKIEADEAKARFQDLYDLAPVGYCSVHESGRITQANLTLAALLGVPRSALLGKPLAHFIYREDQDIFYRLRQQVLCPPQAPGQVDETPGCELRMVMGDGSAIWTQWAARRATDAQAATELHLVVRDIRARRLADEQLLASEERYRALAQDMPLFVSASLPDGTLTYVNAALAALLDQSADNLIGHNFTEYLTADDRALVMARLSTLTPEQSVETHEQLFLAPDGNTYTHQWTNRAIFDSAGHMTRLQAVGQDISQRKKAEAETLLAASVFKHAREGIMITAPDATIIDVNEAFTRVTGYTRDEVLGQNPRFQSSGRQGAAFYAAMWQSLSTNGYWSGEIWNRRKSGEVFAEIQTISAVRDAQGNLQHYVALFSDITALKEHQFQLEHIAHFDALTNLPNRVLLADRLHQAVAQASRRGDNLAVAYLDLDGFKRINDHYGHDVGDRLLLALATQMKKAMRDVDTMARIGGDEFVAVFTELAHPQAALPLLTRLLEAAAQPVQLGDTVVQVSASLGVTFYPQAQPIEADQLLRQADQAMYQAKMTGRNRYHVFDALQDNDLRIHHEDLQRIQQALERHEFVLYYQPKVNMRSGQVIGAEALIRWQHPEKGLLAPAAFLPVIEEHPLAIAIGEWVIDTALRQIELWRDAGLDLDVSVNIGARQLQQADFVERLQAILAMHPQLSPACLELEILETSALNDMTQVSRVIKACEQMGMGFALDDFGTGYSSLAYLKRLHVAMLKIDQSFVRDMLEDPDDCAILQAVLGLASAFKCGVIAEGVETITHGTSLLQLGCDLAQGYGIARPMPPDQLPAWVATWQPDAAWGGGTNDHMRSAT